MNVVDHFESFDERVVKHLDALSVISGGGGETRFRHEQPLPMEQSSWSQITSVQPFAAAYAGSSLVAALHAMP